MQVTTFAAMKISGFTIIRNAILNDYPVVESIRSILPVVDEMVVLVGNSDDDTRGLIASIGDPKIKIFDSVWDPALRQGGAVLAAETDKAFALIDPASDWAFYLQADEAVHERDHPAILAACREHIGNQRVQGLLFRYNHFYGTYDYVGDSRRWYRHEVRVIRNDRRIRAYRDAQGFRLDGEKLWVVPIDASIWHYGWVKSPAQMLAKIKGVVQFWDADFDASWKDRLASQDVFNYDEFDSLARFDGSHPAVMHDRIAATNWEFAPDVSRKRFSFKDKVLYAFEKLTGKRLFEYKNYRKL